MSLLNYNEHNQTNESLDSLTSNSFIPLILQPTRITSHSNTLIDNIFSNVIDPDIISGNLTATISDHLPQFAIIPNMLGNIPGNKSNIYEISNSPVNYAFFAVLCLYYVICHSWPTIRDLSVKKVSGSLGLA